VLRLTAERQRLGLTKAQLGALSNIHPAQIGQIESGRLKPYDSWKARLEQVFGIPADLLFEEITIPQGVTVNGGRR